MSSTSNNSDDETPVSTTSSVSTKVAVTPPPPPPPPPTLIQKATMVVRRTVDDTLDLIHTAASETNLGTYFDCFTDDGYFIGTDVSERWTIPEFYKYTKAYFDQGIGWTYRTQTRHITYLSTTTTTTATTAAAAVVVTTIPGTHHEQQQQQQVHPTVAIFDEILVHERFGITRNSGVMILQQEQHQSSTQDDNNEYFTWKIAQYHLTIPIPNCHVDTIVQIIKQQETPLSDNKQDTR